MEQDKEIAKDEEELKESENWLKLHKQSYYNQLVKLAQNGKNFNGQIKPLTNAELQEQPIWKLTRSAQNDFVSFNQK